MNQNASFFVKLEPKVRCKLPPPIRRSAAFLHPRRAGLWLLEFRLEGSPSGRPCRSYGARLLRAGASEGPASPGLAGGALLSRDGVARRLREAHSFYAHTQQPCRGPWQVMVYYREEGCAHCGDQESSMFRPSQIIPGSRCVPRSWLLAH